MSQENDALDDFSLLIMHYIRLSTLSSWSNIYFFPAYRYATSSLL